MEVLTIPGRTFPVGDVWLDECEGMVGDRLEGWRERDCPKVVSERGGDGDRTASIIIIIIIVVFRA